VARKEILAGFSLFAGWALAISLTASGGALLAAYGAYAAYTTAQAQLAVANKQFVRTNPPKLDLTSLHIWAEGNGRPLDPKNKLPDIVGGAKIEGSASIVNNGPDEATIIGDDIQAVWWRGPLTMNNPEWGDPGQNRLKAFDLDPPHRLKGEITALAPGKGGRWSFSYTIPPEIGPGEALYVIGNVVYLDSIGSRHGLYFARKYVPSEGRFVKPPDADDKYEFSN
jgi:hypothetical protein